MHALLVDTPRYVLLDGQQPVGHQTIGPPLLALTPGPEYVAIYAFSDKQSYDLFCANSEIALTPYPLVKGFLRNQLAGSESTVYIVAVDAAGPNEAHLNAVTMGSLLEAQESQLNQVSSAFQLTLDQESQAYRVEKVLPSVNPEHRQATEGQVKRDAGELESV